MLQRERKRERESKEREEREMHPSVQQLHLVPIKVYSRNTAYTQVNTAGFFFNYSKSFLYFLSVNVAFVSNINTFPEMIYNTLFDVCAL